MRTSSKVGYETIIRAIQQDEQALLEILLQYRQEIQMLSMREIVDDTGRRYQCPDEDMMLRLQVKLLLSIPKFKILSEDACV